MADCRLSSQIQHSWRIASRGVQDAWKSRKATARHSRDVDAAWLAALEPLVLPPAAAAVPAAVEVVEPAAVAMNSGVPDYLELEPPVPPPAAAAAPAAVETVELATVALCSGVADYLKVARPAACDLPLPLGLFR